MLTATTLKPGGAGAPLLVIWPLMVAVLTWACAVPANRNTSTAAVAWRQDFCRHPIDASNWNSRFELHTLRAYSAPERSSTGWLAAVISSTIAEPRRHFRAAGHPQLRRSTNCVGSTKEWRGGVGSYSRRQRP